MENVYTTFAQRITVPMPKNLRNKKAQDLIAYFQKHYRLNPYTNKPENKSTAYLKAVSDALFDPEYWKNPFYAVFPDCGKEWAKAVAIWYHGAQASETGVGVYSPGYQCW